MAGVIKFGKKGGIFFDKDAKTREDLLAEIKDLQARLAETEEALRTTQKNRNSYLHKHAEDKIAWDKERDQERARADEILQFEKIEHRQSEEQLQMTREELRDVSFRLLLAEEAERKRIAQEIHDGITQHWATIRLRVEEILAQPSKEITAPLKDVLPLIQVGLEETRRIQMNLRPALLDDLGILATIKWFCREFQRAHPAIHVETKIEAQENDISNPAKSVIYRVLQEALNNISKHSKTNLVNLSLQKKEAAIEFTIQDHGQGFDLNSVLSQKKYEKGLGLSGMKERIHLSGGSFEIQSIKGIGTTIRASWLMKN